MRGRGGFLLASAFLVAFSILLAGSLAASFTAQSASSSTINASATNQAIIINVTNINSTENITAVNITLFGGFIFVEGTNSTTAAGTYFSNISDALGWANSSVGGFMDGSGNSSNFSFNVSAPATPNSYNIMVSVTDTAGSQSSTNLTYTVVLHNITFTNLSVMANSTATNNNLTYLVNINNTGGPAAQQYNLSVVNCSNTSQSGPTFGTLNATSVSLSPGQSATLQLTISNSSAGVYSSCINASLYADGAFWNFTSSKDSVILNSTFYYLDLNATALNFFNSSGGLDIFAGDNVTVNATLLNTGTQNFTGNMTVSFFWDGALVGSQTILNSSLPNNVPSYTIFNITGGNVTNGLHNISVQVDSSGNVPESNETNNNYTNSTLFAGYNVIVLGITGYPGLNVSVNGNVTINVSVKYGSGNAVTGLEKANFTILDNQSGTTRSIISSNDTSLNSSFTSTMNGVGIYWFNMTSYNPANDTDTLPGTHNLSISVSRNGSSSGNSNDNSSYYLLVHRLVVTVNASSYTMSETYTSGKTVSIYVTNTGTVPIYNVTISVASTNEDYLTLESLSGCDAVPNTLNPYSGVNDCTVKAVPHDVGSDTEVQVTVTATGQYSNSTYYKTGQLPGGGLTITNVATGGGTTGDEDEGDDGGGGTIVRSCSSDASCTANETCNASKKCVAISCPGGEIVDHMCIGGSTGYKINITSFSSALEAVSGENTTTKVTVKNTGTTTIAAKLEVTINNMTASVTPSSYSLDAGESYLFTVSFAVPASTTIGNFSGTFKAYVSTNTSVSASKSFTFTVLPKEETKSEINTTYQELSSLLSNLSDRLAMMNASGRYNQTVLGPLEELLSNANSILERMKNALESDDYVSAESLVSQINTSIGTIESGLEDANLRITGGLQLPEQLWLWVAVIVIIVFVVGFFAYMFYPSSGQGYQPEKGYAHPTSKEGMLSKIKSKFKRKKPAPASVATLATNIAESGSTAQSGSEEEGHYESFHYSEGYKKERSYNYAYTGPKGLFKKLRLRRKKEKKTPQMHIDQFPAATPATQ